MGGFTNKTVRTCYLCTNFFVCLFVFWLFPVKNFNAFLEFTIVFVNLIKIKIKIYLKKMDSQGGETVEQTKETIKNGKKK